MKSFQTPDGLMLAYDEWGEQSERTVPVLLHHGFVADATANWVATGVVEALVAGGRRVVAHDARGHGASEKPHDARRYGEQVMARDLAALADVLAIEQLDVVGYSMGAIVALLFAASDPRVRRLAIGGVGAGVVECGGVDRRAVSNESIIQALSEERPGELDGSQAQSFRALADALGADRKALIAQAVSIYRGGVALERISAPTLILAGAEDVLAVRPELLAEAIPTARVQLLHGDHITALADPMFKRSIVEFLAEGATAAP